MGSFVPVKTPWQGLHRWKKPQPVQGVPPLRFQVFFHLTNLVRLIDIFLPLAVNGGGGQDAEISILQIPRNRFAARPVTPIA